MSSPNCVRKICNVASTEVVRVSFEDLFVLVEFLMRRSIPRANYSFFVGFITCKCLVDKVADQKLCHFRKRNIFIHRNQCVSKMCAFNFSTFDECSFYYFECLFCLQNVLNQQTFYVVEKLSNKKLTPLFVIGSE